jgi:hypothetical protein
MLYPIGVEFLFAVGLLFPYRISALGMLYDQLTLKLVAVTGLSVLFGRLRTSRVPPEVL